MLKDIKINDILFIDIETVSQKSDFNQLDKNWQRLWTKKSKHIISEGQTAEEIYSRAGIYAEFGKIVCISAGFISDKKDGRKFRVKSFYGHNEKEILLEFKTAVEKFCINRYANLCAHNGKEFDFPYISRRMLIHGISMPNILDTSGKKPWEVNLLDTMELWKFGDYKSYTSIDLLTAVFDIPTPKDDIDGSMVGEVYWRGNDIDRIATYCAKDTLTVAQLLLKYRGEDIIKDEDVIES